MNARRWSAPGLLGLAFLALATGAAAQQRVAAASAPAAASATASVPLLRISGPSGPATADFLARGLQKAARDRAPLVVLQIDTPGGLDSSTRQIVKDILASPVPVAAWVAPGAARAASAGAYIDYASHVAAMAPGTNLGAATPVQMGGLQTLTAIAGEKTSTIIFPMPIDLISSVLGHLASAKAPDDLGPRAG